MSIWSRIPTAIVIAILAGHANAASNNEATYCGCPTPWVTISGPAAGTAAHLAQIVKMNAKQLEETEAYNRLSCSFEDQYYPGYCRGLTIENRSIGIVERRNPYLIERGGDALVKDMLQVVIELDFPQGRRLAEVYVSADNISCSTSPANGMLIQAYARSVLIPNFDKSYCEINAPLTVVGPAHRYAPGR